MTGIESLSHITDNDAINNIQEMTKCFISQVDPLKIILFGSYANGTYTEDSDFDFYLVIDDGRSVGQATDSAYHSIINIKRRPVDIVVGTNSRFEQKRKSRHSLMVEREVERNGILLYEQHQQIRREA